MPARDDAFVKWEQFYETIVKHLSSEDANLFEKKVQSTIEIFKSRPFPKPFNSGSKTFTHMGSAGAFIGDIVTLIKPYLARGDVNRVREFLGALNNNILIQGWAFSHNYVGCITITLELIQDPSSEYKIKGFLSPFERPECKNSYMLEGYKGMTITYSTKVFTRSSAMDKQGSVIFDNGNIGRVYNSPTRPTIFSIHDPNHITLIQNYHWNNGRGVPPGTIRIKNQNDQTFGPWQTIGQPGQGGVPNAYWICYPKITLPAGSYAIIDSDPGTWSQNLESKGAGFSKVEGYPQ